jgi:sugar transferase (PEP-CTERM/EpsH1 system associated)
MRILCLTSRLPYPPNRGDRLRAFHFIEHLSQEHDLSLVSFIASESERDLLPSLRAYCREVRVVPMSSWRSVVSTGLNIWRREPLQALYYRLEAMRRMVDDMQATAGFDAAYVHLFRMAPYVANHSQLYRIVDLTDVISREIDLSLPYRGLASRAVYRLERQRIDRYEQWVARNFEETWLISSSDRQALIRTCPEANIRVVPNGVDLEQFHPTGQPCSPESLIFVGHLRVLHNVDAASYLAQDVLPLVQEQVPGCTLNIVGADPTHEIRKLGQSADITVTGFVPDLNEHLNRAAVFVAPLRFAAGIQNKVLEAMAAGRPVVTTSLVNDGLGAQPERDILVADDAQTTAQQIVRLLSSASLREQMGKAGRQFVERRYSWTHVVDRLRIIEKSLQQGRDPAST